MKFSDRYAVEQIWKSCMDYQLDLDNPHTFNEKLQWLKLYYHNPDYTVLADKVKAKYWIQEHVGKQYAVPTLAVYQNVNEINFDSLPNEFVLKCNHDCGSVIIVKDKGELDKDKTLSFLNDRMDRDFYLPYREWCYKNIPHRIICEPYLQDGENSELTDYKFFCFNGEPRFLYVSYGLSSWDTAYINYMNLDWTPAAFHRPDFKEFTQIPPRPSKFDEMLRIAKNVSSNFPFVRVDFFQVNEDLFISEFTFYPGAGLDKFMPPEWDGIIGDMLTLPDPII